MNDVYISFFAPGLSLASATDEKSVQVRRRRRALSF